MSTLKEILTRRPVAATIRLTVPAGGARPAPPVGPALGQYRLNLMAFCKDFNARTQKYKPDTPMSVTITAFKDNTFEFTVKSPKVTWYLKKAAGIESGSGRPGHVVASTLTLKHIYEIAKVKQSDPYCQYMSLEAISKSIIVTWGVNGKKWKRRPIRQSFEANASTRDLRIRYPGADYGKGLKSTNVVRKCGLVSGEQALDYDLGSSNVEEMVASNRERVINDLGDRYIELTGAYTSESDASSVQTELVMLALPAIAGQAIEPLAQLMETAYIGRLGPLELASAGVSISIFNIVSKVFSIPLLSVATSFVAEDISRNARKGSTSDERKSLPSVSTALLLAVGIGTCEALALYFGSGLFLNTMGLSTASPMGTPAEAFLKLRALGSPAVVVSLAIQGIFRGFKDSKTPVLCLGLGNLSAVLLFPILMHYCRLGVTGAAISTIASQYIVTILMIWYLNKRTVLLLPEIKDLDFGGYLRSGGFLLGRTLAPVMTITLSTSMAARQGPLAMAAHQICLQVWLSVSLLADAQAASGQALIASYFAKGDYKTVREITFFALKFVSTSQPVNALAYIFDGLHYGISDFSYAACSMIIIKKWSVVVFARSHPRTSGCYLT